MSSKNFGNTAESFVSSYLSSRSFNIVAHQFYSPFGEIDLIAIKNKALFAIEVKARKSFAFGQPIEAVTPKKLERIRRGIVFFAMQKGLEQHPIQILVASVTVKGGKMDCILTSVF